MTASTAAAFTTTTASRTAEFKLNSEIAAPAVGRRGICTHDRTRECEYERQTFSMSNVNPKKSDSDQPSNIEKDPDEWVTGDEPMTGAQASYLKTLSEEAGQEFENNLTKSEASRRIEELQKKTGRGSASKATG
jgi:hypothetical protein